MLTFKEIKILMESLNIEYNLNLIKIFIKIMKCKHLETSKTLKNYISPP